MPYLVLFGSKLRDIEPGEAVFIDKNGELFFSAML